MRQSLLLQPLFIYVLDLLAFESTFAHPLIIHVLHWLSSGIFACDDPCRQQQDLKKSVFINILCGHANWCAFGLSSICCLLLFILCSCVIYKTFYFQSNRRDSLEWSITAFHRSSIYIFICVQLKVLSTLPNCGVSTWSEINERNMKRMLNDFAN